VRRYDAASPVTHRQPSWETPAGRSLARPFHAGLRAGLAVGAALLCLTAVPRSAAGQSAKDVAAARQAFKEGEEAEGRGDLAIAVTKFRQALAIKATAQLHLRIGAVEEKLGRLADALGSYERSLEKAGSLPAVAKVARELIDALRPRVPLVRIIIDRPPPDLTVTIDGVPMASSALGTEFPIDPGTHRLHAQAPGWLPRDQAFDAPERSHPRLKLDLLPSGDPKPPPPPLAPPPPSRVPGGLLVGGGAAVLVAGAVLFADSFVLDATINGECKGPGRTLCPVSMETTINSQVKMVNVLRFTGAGVGVVGVAGMSVGVYLLTKAPPSPTAGYVRLLPTAGPGAAGATLFGRF
jgi:hypothetical protein